MQTRERSGINRDRLAWTAISIALVLPTVVTWLYFVALAEQQSAWQQLAAVLGKSVQFLIPLLWACGVERQKLYFTPKASMGLIPGAVFGVTVVLAMLIVYHGLLKPAGAFDVAGDEIRRKVASLGIQSGWSYLGLGVFYALVHSGLEEYYWRWFVFAQLNSRVSLGWAIILSSLGFMAHHVILLTTFFGMAAPLAYLGSLSVAIGGAFWAWLYHTKGSVYGCWFSHMLVDAGIFIIGYDLVKDTFS